MVDLFWELVVFDACVVFEEWIVGDVLYRDYLVLVGGVDFDVYVYWVCRVVYLVECFFGFYGYCCIFFVWLILFFGVETN